MLTPVRVARSQRARHPFGVRPVVIIAVVLAVAAAGLAGWLLGSGGGRRPVHLPVLGVYAGPGEKGVEAAVKFGSLTGATAGNVLDFGSSKDWKGITGPDWLLQPHVGQHARLEYSLPMLPEGSSYSLSACAAGDYDVHWHDLASNLVHAGLADTIVRPGWEFNGDWYHWSARGHTDAYVGCFRHVVDTMRGEAGQRFAFDWNPAVGRDAFPADRAYPGDGYVDYVGVDAYDVSWAHYAKGHHDKSARAKAWHDALRGDHGLTFWSTFAARHGKPLAITEWGLTHLSNGHGGEDDPAYVDNMLAFMTDPDNHVAYEHYFDYGSPRNQHSLGAGTAFPHAQRELVVRLAALRRAASARSSGG